MNIARRKDIPPVDEWLAQRVKRASFIESGQTVACLVWVKSTISGYGNVQQNYWGKYYKCNFAHQLAWTVAHGKYDHENLKISHSCGNRDCTELSHLFLKSRRSLLYQDRPSIDLNTEELQSIALQVISQEVDIKQQHWLLPETRVRGLPQNYYKMFGLSSWPQLAWYAVYGAKELESNRTTKWPRLYRNCGEELCINPSHRSLTPVKYELMETRKVNLPKITLDKTAFWQLDKEGLVNWSLDSRYPVFNNRLVTRVV